MKTLANNIDIFPHKINVPYILTPNNLDIKIIGHEKINNRYLITVQTIPIEDDGYRVFLNGRYLSIIISQVHEISRPLYTRNINLNSFDKRNYEVFRSVEIMLPGNNFYLVRHYLLPGNQIMKILLGELYPV